MVLAELEALVAAQLLVRWSAEAGPADRDRVVAEVAALVPGAAWEPLSERTDLVRVPGAADARGAGAGAGVDDRVGLGADGARGADAAAAAAVDVLLGALAADPAVELAAPDRIVEAVTAPGPVLPASPLPSTSMPAGETSADVLPATTTPPTTVNPTPPPDQLFGLQWGLANTGQQVGGSSQVTATAEVDVRWLDAWARTAVDTSLVVGVIDTEVDTGHPDLTGVVLRSIDVTGEPASSRSQRDHGTGVASVIAARSAPGVGMVGVAPGVRVVSIGAFFQPVSDGQVASGPGVSTISLIVRAFEAARVQGVDLINASWVTAADDPMLRAAVADAGVPVVAASGNGDASGVGIELTPNRRAFPASYSLPNLITVTSVGPTGLVPGFANTGRRVVDVAAPGQLVVTAVGPDASGVYQHAWQNGTSFAAPHVTGALALAMSTAPYATTGELLDAVRWTSRYLTVLDGRTITGGMLDVDALVAGVQRPVCRPDQVPEVTFSDVGSGSVHRSGIACLVDAGVMSGRGADRFDPATPVSREQVASILANVIEQALDLPPAAESAFVDVDRGSVHAASIDRLAELGIATGDAEGRFRPRQPVSRGQLAALLVRTYDLLVDDPQPASRSWFDDVPGTTHAASIDRARDLGLVGGVDRLTFDPMSSTRRDQVASLFARHLDALGREGIVW